MNALRAVIQQATLLAGQLPGKIVESLAEAISTKSMVSLANEISQRIPHHHYRDQAMVFVSFWRTAAARTSTTRSEHSGVMLRLAHQFIFGRRRSGNSAKATSPAFFTSSAPLLTVNGCSCPPPI